MRIFLDMDGVFADFHAGYRAISGGAEPPPMNARSRKEEKEMWDRIYATPHFFATLPVIKGAVNFYNQLLARYGLNILAFLTACPNSKFHEVAEEKMLWIRHTLPGEPLVIPTNGSKAKTAYMQDAGDVLIDDHKDNCEAWEDAGGYAIHFTGDWEAVLDELEAHMENYEYREFV